MMLRNEKIEVMGLLGRTTTDVECNFPEVIVLLVFRCALLRGLREEDQVVSMLRYIIFHFEGIVLPCS